MSGPLHNNTFAGLNGFFWFSGVVEDIQDPKRLGRIRVRIAGLHTPDRVDIPVEALQWAYPMSPIQSAGMSGIGITPFGPLPGSWVMGFFRDGVHCQDPVIMGTIAGEITAEPDYGNGFSDPSKTYPRFGKTTDRGKYPVKTDINPLALDDKEEFTPIAWRVKTLIRKIFKAWPFGSYSEPVSKWSPDYAKNHVFETESGHVVEYDDTPGIERMSRMHRSGTYEEIAPDGTRTIRILGDDFEIVLNNKNLAVQGDLNITVQGNVTLITNGDVEQRVKGDYNLAVDGDINFTGKLSMNIRVDQDLNTSVGSDIVTYAGSDIQTGADGQIISQSQAETYIDGSEVRVNEPSPTTVEDPGDIIESRRTDIPSALLDDVTPSEVLVKSNIGTPITDRVAHKIGTKY